MKTQAKTKIKIHPILGQIYRHNKRHNSTRFSIGKKELVYIVIEAKDRNENPHSDSNFDHHYNSEYGIFELSWRDSRSKDKWNKSHSRLYSRKHMRFVQLS